MMIDAIEIYILILVRVTSTFSQSHRGTGKQCLVLHRSQGIVIEL